MGIYRTFWENIANGPLVVDSQSGELRYQNDCVLDDYGNWIPKASDKVIQDQSKTKSKIKGGRGWLRAYELF